MAQHTWEILTTEGLDYLVLEDDDNIEDVFDSYKNDEAGEYLKKTDAKLLKYRQIDQKKGDIMNFGDKMNWKGWKDVRDWCKKNGFDNIVKRMELNIDCWMSSGEFGRNQILIYDSLRYAEDEKEAKEIAEGLNEELDENYGLY